MPNTLFSTYSQGENRVTASILAVFERISFVLVEHILQTLCQETESNLLIFRNQPAGIQSTPDAIIRASFAYWLETKTALNAVRKDQIEAHLKALDNLAHIERQRLLVLTPDGHMPKGLNDITDERVAWANFETLVSVITSLLERDSEWVISNKPLPTEREQELLRELVRFLTSEKLVGMTDQVLVVAARIALPEYQQYSVYMCQPNRAFQACAYLAFYAGGRIHRQIPRILEQIESVVLIPEAVKARVDLSDATRQRLLDLIRRLHEKGDETLRREEAKVMFLSAPDSPETLTLPRDIVNDLTNADGRSVAFTQGQRYVALSKVKKHPHTTSALVK